MRSGAGIWEGELGEDFGPTAERRQCLAVAEVLRDAEYTAAQCGFRSKLQEAVAARFWGCGWEGEGGAGLWGQLKGGPGHLGGVCRGGVARSSARRAGSVGAAEGKGEGDEAARWGRLVSGARVSAGR